MHDMHPGNWIALVIAALLLGTVLISLLRARRERRAAAPQQHRPVAEGDPKHDKAALILIGEVGADGSHATGGS